MEKRTDLGIPYGVANFKTIRTEGLYYVDKTEYLAKDTTLHLILFQFKGTDLVRLEEIA